MDSNQFFTGCTVFKNVKTSLTQIRASIKNTLSNKPLKDHNLFWRKKEKSRRKKKQSVFILNVLIQWRIFQECKTCLYFYPICILLILARNE